MTDAVLKTLADVIESRRPQAGGNPETSYVARLLAGGVDAALKKIGEEATELVMAVKDAAHSGGASQDHRARVVAECADLWFHCLVVLAAQGLRPEAVLAELARRAGTSGLEEKAARKAQARAHAEGDKRP
ncbi:MAG TPA: phosphoribosyl-ATP diphosphatase [Burkholderiaceae bacterium]|nr:phosphoribosyl-ATP diphosphatase [Burkholderiaceae bacterium]